MQKIPLLLFLGLFFSFAVSAQTSQSSNCPTLDVSGGGLVKPGQVTTFTANVIDPQSKVLNPEYVWTTSSGKIISGQGTPTITIAPEKAGENITVTVEIKGFPEGCRNTESDNLGCGLTPPESINFGEFLNFDTADEKKRLEELKNKIADFPGVQVYVIGRFRDGTSDKQSWQNLKKTGAFLMKEFSLDADRITMVRASAEQDYTEIWLVPPGAKNPEI